MKEQAEKLQQVERKLCASRGEFDLFALFLREDAPNKWDLLISSEWSRTNKLGALTEIVEEIKSVLNDQELLLLSRIVILEKDNPALLALTGAMHVENSLIEISDSMFNGLAIKSAYLITARRPVS